jgi:hypothetical protein
MKTRPGIERLTYAAVILLALAALLLVALAPVNLMDAHVVYKGF